MENRVLSPFHSVLLAGIVSITVFSVLAGLRATGSLQRLEFAHYDWMLTQMAVPQPASDVVVVAIDDKDLRAWGWPLSDNKLAEIIEALTVAEVSVIGVDIYRDNAVMEGRERLERAFDNANVVWITKLDSTGGYSINAPDFAQEAGRVGFADIPIDFDGVARRGLVLVRNGDGLSLALSAQLALLASAQNVLKAWPEDPRVLMFGQTPVPYLTDGFGGYRGLDDAGYQVLLDYDHQLPIAATIRAGDLLAGTVASDSIRGRVAIIGVTSESIKDNFRTPLNNPPWSPFTFGVQVHAAFAQQLLDYSALRTVPLRSPGRRAHLFIVLIATVCGATLGIASRTVPVALFLGPGLSLVTGVGSSAMMYNDLWLPVIPMSAAWLFAFIVSYLVIGVISRRQRRAIARLFSDHLSPELSAQIWKERDVIFAGGKPRPMRMQVSILFADLVGSTAIGASANPKDFMSWASHLLDEMCVVSRENGGFIEKFTGDGILVVFGAPLPRLKEEEIRDDAIAACRAALQIADVVKRLNTRADLLAQYGVRIGLHSGPVLSGTLGATGSLQYNIMGDTVNVAARIEAFAKTLKNRQTSATQICLSKDLLVLTDGRIECEPVGNLLHDDKKRKFEIFELKGISDQKV